MFKLALVASLLALTVAQYGHHAPSYESQQGGYSEEGPSYGGNGHDDLAQPTPYKYGYDIVGGDKHSGDFKQTREETSDGHGNVKGSYGYTDSHGNQRQVDYVADHHGFRATVKTNEPGTDKQNPADVQFLADPPKYQQASYGGGYGGQQQGGYGDDSGYGGQQQGGYGGQQGGYGGQQQGGYGGGAVYGGHGIY